MDIARQQLTDARDQLTAAGITDDDRDQGLAAVLALASPTTYTAWRRRISTMTTQDIVREYGHDHCRHVSVLAGTPLAGDA